MSLVVGLAGGLVRFVFVLGIITGLLPAAAIGFAIALVAWPITGEFGFPHPHNPPEDDWWVYR